MVLVRWVPCAFSAAFTAYVLHALKREWELFVGWRVGFLVHGDPDAQVRIPPSTDTMKKKKTAAF